MMESSCKLFIDLEGNVFYKLNFFGIDLLEALPSEVLINDHSSLEKAAESISEEIKAGTFNYFKWFPEGTLSKKKEDGTNNTDSTISLYGPYLWAILKERVEALESQQKLVEEELATALACKNSFLSEGKN